MAIDYSTLASIERHPRRGVQLHRVDLAPSTHPDYTSTPADMSPRIKVINSTGADIAADTLVYITDWDTTSGNVMPKIAKAQGTSGGKFATFITDAAIANGARGWVTKLTVLTAVNTGGSAEGNPVYLSDATAGAWTLTKPTATDKVQIVGKVINAHATTGILVIDLMSPPEQIVHTHATNAEGGVVAAAVVSVADANSLITATEVETALNEAFQHIQSTQQFLPLPLAVSRIIASNDIAISSTGGSAGGPTPAKDTVPILEYANGDTDSSFRLNWAAGNQTAIAWQAPLPPNLNVADEVVFHFRAAVESAVDNPVLDLDVYFNEGDTKISPATAAITNTAGAYAEYTAIVSATDVPSGAQTVTAELTPGTHANDALYISAAWIEYTGTTLTS